MLTLAPARRTGPTTRSAAATINFSLFAPNNSAATLRGDFSDWKDIRMVKGPDGVFQANVPLPDGLWQYTFRIRSRSWFFKPNQWVEIVDPRATEVDRSGQRGILRVKNGQVQVDDYTWKHDHVLLPSNDQLVIYELHVADFGGEGQRLGTFRDVMQRLDHLVELGINALEFMPLKHNPGRYSWGYNPRHFWAVDTNYGTTHDFKRLVDECHRRGVRVFVFNHGETGTPLAHIDHDYWFRHEPLERENSWGPEFNYDLHDEARGLYPTRQFVCDTLSYWVREFHLDGIRYDAARQMDNFEAMRELCASARRAARSQPFYNVAEYLPQNPAVAHKDGPMDAAWHENLYYCLIDHLCHNAFDVERLKAAIDGRREGFDSAISMINYLSNHDHNHFLADAGDCGWFDDLAFAKARQAAALCLTAVGVPLLWMGEEFGEYRYRNEAGSRLDWSLLRHDRNRHLYDFYRKLIALRQAEPALRGDHIDFFYEHIDKHMLGYLRWQRNHGVIVLLNFSHEPHMAELHDLPPGLWTCLLDRDVHIIGPHASIPLPPCGTLVLVGQALGVEALPLAA